MEQEILRKLEQLKEIRRRNEQYEKTFAEMKVEQKRKYNLLADLYVNGEITKEDFHLYLKNLRTSDKQ